MLSYVPQHCVSSSVKSPFAQSRQRQGHHVMVYYPFNMVFVNARMRTLTHRALCLSGFAAAIIIVKFVIFFLSGWNLLKEFHEEQMAAEGRASLLEGPLGKLIMGVGALILALIVPCCAFFGAKTNNRACVCCFACCNCCGGCLTILQAIVIVLIMVAFGSIETLCQSPGSCEGLMKGCKHHKSEFYHLDTYEGCLDYVVSMFPSIYAGLGVVLGLNCLVICLQCGAARWGKELYDVLKYEDLCMDSDTDVWRVSNQ